MDSRTGRESIILL